MRMARPVLECLQTFAFTASAWNMGGEKTSDLHPIKPTREFDELRHTLLFVQDPFVLADSMYEVLEDKLDPDPWEAG